MLQLAKIEPLHVLKIDDKMQTKNKPLKRRKRLFTEFKMSVKRDVNKAECFIVVEKNNLFN